MPLFLEASEQINIQIEFREECLPTCYICGDKMNYLTIMSDCIWTQRELNLIKNNQIDVPELSIPRRLSLEGGTTHIHFHHHHPVNKEVNKIAYYCPLYNKKW